MLEREILEGAAMAVGGAKSLGPVGPFEEQDELFAAEAAAIVDAARLVLEARRRAAQNLVSHRMAELVVDPLEVVEVEEENGEGFLAFDQIAQDVEKRLAIGKAGEWVERRFVPKAISLAEKLAAVSKTAMAQTKRLFHEVVDLPLDKALERGRDLNQRMRNFEKLAGSPKKK